jgi:hypothetical protein
VVCDAMVAGSNLCNEAAEEARRLLDEMGIK